MSNLKKVSVSVAALVASTFVATTVAPTIATAADLPPIVEIPREVTPQPYGGWYLRGDIGYAKNKVESVGYFQGPTFTGSFEQHDLANSWMIGGGLGYQINDWFRVDATANYFTSSAFTGSSAQNVGCSDGTLTAICSYSDNSSAQITTLLANAYVDLGTWQGFTPYVGAGIGGAYIHWGSLRNVESHVSGAAPTILADDTHGAVAGWRFAYALHAGTSYDLSANLKLDAGYSYTHIEGGDMFGFGSGSGFVGVQGQHGDIKNHAFRVGLRYSFN